MPALIQRDRTFLAFYLESEDGDSTDRVGVVEWLHCGGAVLGGLNEEAFHGHPLWRRGLSGQRHRGPLEVLGSRWISEWELANRVHDDHYPPDFQELRHFLLPFQDETFECLATGFRAYRTDLPMDSVLVKLASLLNVDEAPPYDEVHEDAGPPGTAFWERERPAPEFQSPTD
jgi:hypothetical protein